MQNGEPTPSRDADVALVRAHLEELRPCYEWEFCGDDQDLADYEAEVVAVDEALARLIRA